jgi:hypothetical protein
MYVPVVVESFRVVGNALASELGGVPAEPCSLLLTTSLTTVGTPEGRASTILGAFSVRVDRESCRQGQTVLDGILAQTEATRTIVSVIP